MKMQLIVLFLATMSTGLMAGIFFTWTNAVTPGIGKLKDIEYLSALQSMNRVILNPVFYLIFICPILTLPLTTILNYNSQSSLVFILLLVATTLYLTGAFVITIIGNIPLNNLLHKNDLVDFSLKNALNLRNRIEEKWNNYNLVRTISSFISFILLIAVCLLIYE